MNLLVGFSLVVGYVIDSAVPTRDLTVVVGQVQLKAVDALIMTGTDMHNVNPAWVDMAVHHFIEPALGGDYTGIPVTTPEEFWPFGGIWDETIDDSVEAGVTALNSVVAETIARHAESEDPSAPIVVFGYSQSAIIVTLEKRRLQQAAAQGQAPPPLSFVVIANPNRPNGGINERFAGLRLPGWTFSGATPTDTWFPTVDVVRQYDPFADFPLYPLNAFALANAFLGLFYAHDYGQVTLNQTDPGYKSGTVVEQHGDTTYYFIPAEHLPLLQPLYDLDFPHQLLDTIEPVLRVLVELGYDRSIPFGQPAPAKLFPGMDLARRQTGPATLRGHGGAQRSVRTAPDIAAKHPIEVSRTRQPSERQRPHHARDVTRNRSVAATVMP